MYKNSRDKFRCVNAFLIGSVCIMFVIAILTFLWVAFCESKVYEFFTMLAAFTSAIAAAGTLFIAYLAYKKTDDWFQQKKNENGFNYVVAFMTESDDVFAASICLYKDICKGDDLVYIKSSVELYTTKTLALKRKLLACQRWNIKSRLEVTMYFYELREFYKISSTVLTCLEQPDYFSGLKNNHIDRLTTCKSRLEKYNIQCSKPIEKLFEFPSK